MADRQQIEARGYEEVCGDGRRLLLFEHESGDRVLWDAETGRVYEADLRVSAENTQLMLMEVVLLLREILEDPSAARKRVLLNRLDSVAFPQPSTPKGMAGQGGG